MANQLVSTVKDLILALELAHENEDPLNPYGKAVKAVERALEATKRAPAPTPTVTISITDDTNVNITREWKVCAEVDNVIDTIDSWLVDKLGGAV